MAEVFLLDDERARRAASAPAPRQRPGMALLWLLDGSDVGHRREPGVGAACGAQGSMILAEPGVQPCRDCYPLATEPRAPQ